MTPFEKVQEYIDLGWVVLPVVKGEKRPAVNWKEYQERKPTPEEYKKWFNGQGVGVGLISGKASGVTVIDFDSYKKDAPKVELNTPLKVKTGGGGLHGYFKYQEGVKNTVGGDVPIDVRGEGGFVVLPPTIHPNGKPYEWLYDNKFPLSYIARNLPALDESLLENFVNKSNSQPLDITKYVDIEEGSRNDSLHRLSCSLLTKYPPKEAWQVIGAINRTYKPPIEEKELQTLFGSAASFIENNKKSSSVSVSWPRPLADRAFHGLVGEIVKVIEPHSEADPVALLIGFLTAFGSAVGDSSHFKVEADLHPMRLFCVLVGETSKARKGTSWAYIRNLFGSIDEDWKKAIQSGLSSGEGLIWAVRDEITKSQPTKEKGRIVGYEEVVIDQGIKDKRLLIVESEFASTLRVLGREGNTLSALIRNSWDTGNLQSLTKNSQAKATRAHISIMGHITKDELLRYLTSTEAANGFGNRFLWFCVKRSKSLPFGGNIQEVDFAPLAKRLSEAVVFAGQMGEIKWSEETKSMWAEIYTSLSEGKIGLTGALTARAEANVTRLACIYALLDKSNVIKPVHLLAATAVWDYAESSVAFIFQFMTGDPLANDILEALEKEPEGMTRTDISNYFGRNKSSEQISAALEILQGLGRVRNETIPTAGRSREVWILTKDS